MPTDRDTLVELYKLAVETADRTSARRATANAFFLTVQTALAGLAAALPVAGACAATAVYLAALTLCGAWWIQLRTYRALSRARFAAISELEADLPVALFTDEWAGRPRVYIELGLVERTIPYVFAAIHTLAFASMLTA
ncbi:RipA family octameric membrane protein [Actinomadura nitritigenes]|uniref:RipA family octameric membrane protein n=1 Tax=Actinomadura nitritigenes TaxID=134602 RepID=UPI003D8C5890